MLYIRSQQWARPATRLAEAGSLSGLDIHPVGFYFFVGSLAWILGFGAMVQLSSTQCAHWSS
jgi:hypothetical protein